MKNFVFLLLISFIVFSGCLDFYGMNQVPKQCTQTGGKLLIKDFDFNSDTIQLNIQNGWENDITVTEFKGIPVPLTWENADSGVIKRTDVKYFALHGSFAGNITEEITIYYTSNGLKKAEKTTCSGPV